jgi:hypothetical protein
VSWRWPRISDQADLPTLIQTLNMRLGALHDALATVSLSGLGSPETVVAAPVGTIYLRTDGGAATTIYIKESGSGNVGWVGK